MRCWFLVFSTLSVGYGEAAISLSNTSAMGSTTAMPFTTALPETSCPSPPCTAPGTFLQLSPTHGPNNNQQEGTTVVTITGVFWPVDCNKGCVFTPPCDACEMEVSYWVYFGTESAGCNFHDPAASACQCTAVNGQEIVSDCRWMGMPYASKYRCNSITCQVYGDGYLCAVSCGLTSHNPIPDHPRPLTIA
jgi:hypothetical protein